MPVPPPLSPPLLVPVPGFVVFLPLPLPDEPLLPPPVGTEGGTGVTGTLGTGATTTGVTAGVVATR